MFQVRFHYDPDREDGFDLIKTVPTEAAAEQFRTEQLEMEGWDDEPGSESDQYVIVKC